MLDTIKNSLILNYMNYNSLNSGFPYQLFSHFHEPIDTKVISQTGPLVIDEINSFSPYIGSTP